MHMHITTEQVVNSSHSCTYNVYGDYRQNALLQPMLLLREPEDGWPHDGGHDPRPLHLLHRSHGPLLGQQVGLADRNKL
jgi:hypothetical protein